MFVVWQQIHCQEWPVMFAYLFLCLHERSNDLQEGDENLYDDETEKGVKVNLHCHWWSAPTGECCPQWLRSGDHKLAHYGQADGSVCLLQNAVLSDWSQGITKRPIMNRLTCVPSAECCPQWLKSGDHKVAHYEQADLCAFCRMLSSAIEVRGSQSGPLWTGWPVCLLQITVLSDWGKGITKCPIMNRLTCVPSAECCLQRLRSGDHKVAQYG